MTYRLPYHRRPILRWLPEAIASIGIVVLIAVILLFGLVL